MNVRAILLASALALFASLAAAETPVKSMTDRAAAQGAAASTSEGEVRKVDKGAKKITLKHGDIKNLGMPAMTMVFRVKDDAMLDKVKAGDKVQFSAEDLNGALTIMTIEYKKRSEGASSRLSSQ